MSASPSIDGILVVDKPRGLTSHDLVDLARRCLREKQIGHTGTLDPMATGVLALACGKATRLVRFLIASDKDYEATIRFGVTTDSYDVMGTETSRTGRSPAREQIDAALSTLRGEYLQRPPDFSAKKVQGKRAYDLARARVAIELTPVPVSVTRADVIEWDGATVRIALTSSAGFYVRSFAHELGQAVGTGACLEALRRTRSGEFSLRDAVSADVLREDAATAKASVVALDALLPTAPRAVVTVEGRRRVGHGRELEEDHFIAGPASGSGTSVPPGGPPRFVRLLDEDGHLVGIGTPGPRSGALHPLVVLI